MFDPHKLMGVDHPKCQHMRMRVLWYLIAFGKPAGHRVVAPRDLDVHSRWLTVYQMNTARSRYHV